MSDRFTPIRGTESQILASEPTKGYIWFALDTKKIYYSNGEEFISMGGNSSIYYGKMMLSEEPEEGQVNFDFQFLDIDGNTEDEKKNIPNYNDLILNIPDGCFYRVREVDLKNEIIVGTKLTIAGSGTGGGGGATGPTAGTYSYNRIGSADLTALYQDSCSIGFRYVATDMSGESTGNAKAVLKVGGVVKSEFIARQGNNTVEIGQYLTLGENKAEITLTVNTGLEDFKITKKWTVTTVSVQLVWDYNETTVNYVTQPFMFSWSVTGDVLKTTHIIIDDLYELHSEPTKRLNTQDITIPVENFSLYGLGHGAHKVEMYVTAQIDDSIITTPSTVKNLIFVDIDNKSPIISTNFYETEITQYNTVQIPIVIYNPEATTGMSNVMLREDTELKDTWTDVVNCSVRYWSYTPVTAGEKTLTIICNDAERQLILNVNALNIDNEEVGGYAFKFKGTDFSSNAAVQAWESNGVTLETSNNFDWINGGLKTELDENNNVRQFVCVKAGTTLTIDYDMFNVNALNDGKTIKMIFKAVNCRDYDAQVLKCYDDSNNIGLIMRAQNATLKSSLTSLTTNYCEDTYIEFEVDIWPSEEKKLANGIDVSERYMIGWLDGVPSGASVYSSEDRFRTNQPQKIVIGSNECDVYLYTLKVYERHLKDDDHLANFIADAPNADEMLARYKRNDILDDNGDISFLKLANANPDCRVHLLEMSRMTTSKGDPVKDCIYTQYHGSSEALMSAEKVSTQVQGTSSAAYGIAAFNLDLNFGPCTEEDSDTGEKIHYWKDAKNNPIEKWSMDENAIAVDYFNFKVNVASAEGANNALNQEWYNRYQPYICKWRKKNAKARDTMQFYPGVLFIKDNNPVTDDNGTGDNVFKDTPGYIQNPKFKLYSVCNMGNSKKNRKVFHDSDNPKEVCIEVTDNQTAGQWMTIPQGYYKETTDGEPKPRTLESIDTEEDFAAWTLAMDDNAYDFRYPKSPTDEMRRAWFRFVNWMSKCDPSPKYNSVGQITEEKFINYTTDHYENNALVEAIDLYKIVDQRHIKVDDYEEGVEYFLINPAHPYGYTEEPLDEPQTFSAYTFGAQPWSNIDADGNVDTYVNVLNGLQIVDYAGTYTVDNYKYRIAKMLQECEQYLIMDALVFHYLFIERHCMIDNVAKNTFWSTEDLIHWAPIKDYDNDTADGNDNEGKLTLTYGLEALDQIGNRYVFNAHDSVWLNFINGLDTACQKMYANRQNAGAWDINNYLNAFDEWQSTIPEKCWIEDYHRKYLRPREVYGSNDYIGMLEGGKKTHQRKQFEKYQDYYMCTKYNVGNCANDSAAVFFRANTQGMEQDYFLPIKMYCDCYVRSSIGQQLTKQRVKRNETSYIKFDHNILGSMNDATCLLSMAELYTSIGDMSVVRPKEVRVTAAKRLRELIIGDREQNENMEEAISIGSNVMLEKLIVKKCTNIDEKAATLNLTGAIGLRELDLSQSTFTGIQLADGAPIHTISLYRPSSLTMNNLEQIETFNIDSYENIVKLNTDNIDKGLVRIGDRTLSQALVEETVDIALHDYNLKNVIWTLDEATDINTATLKINLLEKIMTKFPSDKVGNEISKALALTGDLLITDDAYDGSDSFDIYNKYAQADIYPNLDIYFVGNTAKLHSIKIYNGNDELYWFRKINNGGNIDSTFLSDGPIGQYDISKIIKSNTESSTFTFLNEWEVYNEDGEPVEIGNNGNIIEGTYPELENITQDLIFKPVFQENVRIYEVKFYNGQQLLNPNNYTFAYGTPLEDALPKEIPYRSDEGLEREMTNAFIGYGLTETSSTPINENTQIKANLTLYAMFVEKSVYDNVLDNKYLQFFKIQGSNTYRIGLRGDIKLTGKITLPITYDNTAITMISENGFSNQNTLTHIFWERKAGKTNEVNRIGPRAFQDDIKLVYFEMPEGVTQIPDNCFQNDNMLLTDSSQEEIINFFKNITSIGNGACNRLGYNNRNGLNYILYLPETLTSIGDGGFSMCGFKRIQLGSLGKPSQLNPNLCGSYIFQNTMIGMVSFAAYINMSDLTTWSNFQNQWNITLASGGQINYIDASSGETGYTVG